MTPPGFDGWVLREPAARPPAAEPDALSPRWPTAIEVLIPGDRARGWSRTLAEALAARFAAPVQRRRVPGLKARAGIAFEAVERLAGLASPGHSAWIDAGDAPSCEAVEAWAGRLVVNATGHDPLDLPPAILDATVLSPVFQGAFDLQALAIPLSAGTPAHLGVAASSAGMSRLLYGIRLAPADRTRLEAALDVVLARAMTLLCSAANHLIAGSPRPDPVLPPEPGPIPGLLEFSMRRLMAIGPPRLGRALGLREAWRVGVRPLRVETGPEDLDLDPAGFDLLDCPRGRFYADPFVLRHEGVAALLFEDFDFGLGRACISRVALKPGEPPSPAEPVLTRPYHLSYPFLFVHDGAALMLPETSANRTIELYEAEAFPDRWRRRCVLIDGIDASDSTLHHDEAAGLWWLFTAVSEFGGSSHDGLWLFFSERLEGPWRPHPGNPVKLDPAGARPAGPLLPWGGRLYRPGQDCSRTYGGGLVWFEIERLDPHAFREEPAGGQARDRPHFPVHTYGRAAGWEVADFKGRRWRYLT